MELLDHIRQMTTAQLERFAIDVGTTVAHIRNVAYKSRKPSAALAMQIEIQSGGQVSRQALRPEDYMLIWPDLVQQRIAPVGEGSSVRAIG